VAAVRARWSSSSFLLYAGGLIVLAAVAGLLSALARDYGNFAFVGLSAAVFGGLTVFAVALRARGEDVAAGLFAVSAVVAFGVLVGSIETWFGWLANTDSAFSGFHPGNLLLELVVIGAALFARRILRFPLLVPVIAVVSWYFVTDLLSNGGNWSAAVTIGFGLVLMLAARGFDPVYAFWWQVVAGVTIGGGLLFYWHSSDTDWVLIGLASLVYVVVAARLRRSSYAVLAAIGVFLVTTHFVTKWFGSPFLGVFFGSDPNQQPWAQALSYGVLGLVLMALGLWLTRGRGHGVSGAAVARP
jgi:hypothetical protein